MKDNDNPLFTMPTATEPSQPDSPWFVYIVRCHDRTYYTGITTDLDRRLSEHNGGQGAKYTRPRRPVVLVYSEPAHSRSEAARREYQIKQLSPAGKKRLINVAAAVPPSPGEAPSSFGEEAPADPQSNK